MRPRIKNPPPRSAVRVAQTETDWIKLMQAAIQMAEKSQDKRIHGLRAALAIGQSERHLRQMSIVCPADLAREFPVK